MGALACIRSDVQERSRDHPCIDRMDSETPGGSAFSPATVSRREAAGTGGKRKGAPRVARTIRRPPLTYAYPAPTSRAVSEAMRGNRSRDTRPELRLRSDLHRKGLRFRANLALELEGITIRPDIVFSRRRVAVFVDGCFWHSCKRHGTRPRVN